MTKNSPDRNTPNRILIGPVVSQRFVVGHGHNEHDTNENGRGNHPHVLPQSSGAEAEHEFDILHPLLDTYHKEGTKKGE